MKLLKGLYFLAGFASACGPLYLPLIYNGYFRLSKEQVGIIMSIVPLISCFSTPAVTFLGERWLGMKRILCLCTLLGTCVFDLHLAVPAPSVSSLALVAISVIMAATLSPVGTLLDSITLNLLAGDSKAYGKQRLWSSISWGLGSLCTGLLVDFTGQILCIFPIFTVTSLIQFIMQLFLPSTNSSMSDPECGNDGDGNEDKSHAADDDFSNEDYEQGGCGSNNRDAYDDQDEDDVTPLCNQVETSSKTLTAVIFSPSTILFLLSITLLGMVFSLLQTFLFIFMTRELGASSSLVGLTTPFSIALEIPIFYYSRFILGRLGPTRMIYLAHALLIIRLLIYMNLHEGQAFAILPVELIHGAAFAFTWSAGIEYSQSIAPETYASTFISIYCTLYNNVGGILGTVVGGILYERLGHWYLWLFCIALLALSLILFSSTRFLSNK